MPFQAPNSRSPFDDQQQVQQHTNFDASFFDGLTQHQVQHTNTNVSTQSISFFSQQDPFENQAQVQAQSHIHPLTSASSMLIEAQTHQLQQPNNTSLFNPLPSSGSRHRKANSQTQAFFDAKVHSRPLSQSENSPMPTNFSAFDSNGQLDFGSNTPSFFNTQQQLPQNQQPSQLQPTQVIPSFLDAQLSVPSQPFINSPSQSFFETQMQAQNVQASQSLFDTSAKPFFAPSQVQIGPFQHFSQSQSSGKPFCERFIYFLSLYAEESKLYFLPPGNILLNQLTEATKSTSPVPDKVQVKNLIQV